MKRDYSLLNDHELVDLLLANDHGAWNHVLLGAALRFASQRKFREILARTRHEPMEAVAELCKNLYANGFARLRAFAFRGSFDAWLWYQVRDAVGKVARLDREGIEIPADPQDPLGPIEPAAQPAVPDGVRDRMDDVRTLFVRLWKDAPVKAWALFMRAELELPTKDIALLLDQSPANVDQLVKRGREQLKEFERALLDGP